jgi:diaminopimelate epimerase
MPVRAMGGHLSVSLIRKGNGFKDIWLEGPATYVFKGQLEL